MVETERNLSCLRHLYRRYRRASSGAPDSYRWRLEDFIACELLDCGAGAHFESIDQPSIQTLFYRRSGPIAAAISITIEAPIDSSTEGSAA